MDLLREIASLRYDAVIVGSGFSGNLLGWILAECGWRVLIVDRQDHPRFAIGESSTPLGDILVERLADHYGLDALKPLARWGTCREALPQLRVGKKRGFSYFEHEPGRPFADTPSHDRSLLVAASATDRSSDLHWMRSDVDAWLFQQACRAGCDACLGVDVTSLQREDGGWQLLGRAGEEREAWKPASVDADRQPVWPFPRRGGIGRLAGGTRLGRSQPDLQSGRRGSTPSGWRRMDVDAAFCRWHYQRRIRPSHVGLATVRRFYWPAIRRCTIC